MNTPMTNVGTDIYRLRLFVAGNEPNSTQARANLTTLCETYLQGRYQLETIDVLRDFQAALRDNILVTPTLKVVAPVQALQDLHPSRANTACYR